MTTPAPWTPGASPQEIQDLADAREAAYANAGHVEYTTGRGSPETRYAAYVAREAGRRLHDATHPSRPYLVRDGQFVELEAG